MEGRRVVNNIQRSASLYLVKNIFPCCLQYFHDLYDQLSTGTVTDFADQYVYDWNSVFCACIRAKQRPHTGTFYDKCVVEGIACRTYRFLCCQQSGIVLSGIWCERRGHFDILYDTCCYCWIYDLISDRKTDDGWTPGTDGWNGRRLAVLHDICQPLICNQGYLRAVYDADCGIYGCSGVHSAVSVEICGVDAGKSFSVKKENTSGNSMKEDRYSVRIKTG